MEHEEFLPDDSEKISRIEHQVSVLRGLLKTAETNYNTMSKEMITVKDELKAIKDLVKQVRVGFICLIVGITLGGVVWGIYTIREATSLIR